MRLHSCERTLKKVKPPQKSKTLKRMIFQLVRRPGPKDMRASADAFIYLEYGMTFVGWLPPVNYRNLYLLYRAFILWWSIVYLPFGLVISYTEDIKSFTPSELLTSLQALINIFGCAARVTTFYMYSWQYRNAKKLLNRLDEFCVNDADYARVHYWVKRCNIIFVIYQIVYSNYPASTYLTATFNGMAPWRIYNPLVNWRSSTKSLWIASTWEYAILIYTVMQNQLVDVSAVLFALMLIVHIKILRKRVGNLRTDPDEPEEKSYEELAKCIKHHKLILEYSDTTRTLISRVIFIQFLLIGLILGCTLVNLFFFSDFWNALACALYVVGCVFQTFPFCYICDLVIAECNNLSIDIFHSNWLGSSRRYRTTIAHFLHNAQQPIEFTAGSIFPICMQTNIKVAKLAFSVVTFVNQLNITEKLTKN